MAKGKIILEIDEAGNPTISVQGMKGPGCKALTKPLEDIYGRVVSSKKTAEYHQVEQAAPARVRR